MNRLQAAAARVNGQRAIDLLRDLIRIPGVTGQEADVARFVVNYMKAAGFDDVTIDEKWNVLGTVRGGGDGPALVLLTHTDSGPPGQMADPHSAAVMDGDAFGKSGQVVYGRGASAPKAALAAFIEGARALVEWGRDNWRGTLRVACVTKDLSANHEGVRELHESTGIAADFVIAGEPSDNQVVMGARGISHVQVTLKGVETHWGRPSEGVNPLYGLADVLDRVKNLKLPSHPVLGSATVSAIAVSSDAEPPRTPHTARAIFDRRVLPGETPDDVLAAFRQVVNEVCAAYPGMQGDVEQIRGMYSFSAPQDSPLKSALLEAGQAVTGRDIGTTYITFSSNAGFTIQGLGIPGVAFAPGRITDVGPREHVEVDKVIEGARITAAVCARLLS